MDTDKEAADKTGKAAMAAMQTSRCRPSSASRQRHHPPPGCADRSIQPDPVSPSTPARPFSPSGPFNPSESPPSSLAGRSLRPCPLATYRISHELRRKERDRDEESEDDDWHGDLDVEAMRSTMFPVPPFGVLRTANVGVGGLGGLPSGSLSLLLWNEKEEREQRDAIGRRSAAAAAAA
mmetsp:Transcript_34081/g.84303  ORF Transcript_34081/g.84303 Transcript_34081/m.84303 type:complete len:179 (-) Transcript_34081:66-602(-)